MKHLIWIAIALLLGACSSATPTPSTGQQVIDRFVAAGLEVSDVRPGERTEGTPLPNTYEENIDFTVAEVAPKGGQIFVCKTKEYCDTLMTYFDAFKALAGPYLYQSPNGLVVAQLNSGLTTDTAEKFEEVIKRLP